jgi:PleD family two-component response regulator
VEGGPFTEPVSSLWRRVKKPKNWTDPTYVLVVEDDLLSRLHASNLVGDAGYVPIEATNADEAIAILESRKDIRIVFTDIDARINGRPETGSRNS